MLLPGFPPLGPFVVRATGLSISISTRTLSIAAYCRRWLCFEKTASHASSREDLFLTYHQIPSFPLHLHLPNNLLRYPRPPCLRRRTPPLPQLSRHRIGIPANVVCVGIMNSGKTSFGQRGLGFASAEIERKWKCVRLFYSRDLLYSYLLEHIFATAGTGTANAQSRPTKNLWTQVLARQKAYSPKTFCRDHYCGPSGQLL